MPATSKAQQRFMGMNLAKKRAGEKTGVKMSERQLKDFAGTKLKGLPNKAKVGKGQAAPPPTAPAPPPMGKGQADLQSGYPAGAAHEQMRSTYGPYDPAGYREPGGGVSPGSMPQEPVTAPPGQQVPGMGGPSSPIDQEIQRLLMMKQQQIQQGQQALQGQMGGQQPPMGQPQPPGMGQALPPGMAPPPIGTGLQTMPLGGKPLQDPSISSALSPGIASRALGGPPPISPPPISGMPSKPTLPGGPPKLGGPPKAKAAPKKGAPAAKKVRGKPRPAAGGKGMRKGKTGIGQAGAASCDPQDKKKVGMGQAAPAGAGQLAANDPYMMVKGRPYEQMPNGMLAPMVSPSTGQEAQPQQATAQPMGPPPQQGGVAPMGMARPPAPPIPTPPAGVGMGQGDPTIGGALAGQMGGAPATPPGRAQVSLGAPVEQPRNPRPRPAPIFQGPPENRPSEQNWQPAWQYWDQGSRGGWRGRSGGVGAGQGVPPAQLAGVGAAPTPAPGVTSGGGVSPMGIPRQRPAGPTVPGGAPGVPAVGLGQSSKKSMPMKKRGGY